MSVYLLCVDGNPIHSFIASDDRTAAAIARGMINKTAYGYKGDCEIILQAGLKPDEPPKLFNSIVELYSIDVDGLGCNFKATVCQVKDPLLDAETLKNLYFDCLPVDKRYEEIGHLSNLVAEVNVNG